MMIYREFQYAKNGGKFVVNMERVALVQSCQNGHAVLFLDGDVEGIEVSMPYEAFIESEIDLQG